MADNEDPAGMEVNTGRSAKKLLDDSQLQQPLSGSSSLQASETVNSQNLASGNFQHFRLSPESLTNQELPVEDNVALGFEPGSSFTGLVEAASTHLESLLQNQNSFQQQGNDFQQQPYITSDFMAPFGNFTQEQNPFEFENYANQILGLSLMPQFVTAGAESTTAYNGDGSLSHQGVLIPENQKMTNDVVMGIMGIPESTESFSRESEYERQFGLTANDETQERNNTEIENLVRNDGISCYPLEDLKAISAVLNDEKAKENDSGDFLINDLEMGEVVITESEPNLATGTIIVGLHYIDGTLINIIGGLSNAASGSKQEILLPTTENQKLEKTRFTNEEEQIFLEHDKESQRIFAEMETPETVHPEEPVPKEMWSQVKYSALQGKARVEEIRGDEIYPKMEEISKISTNETYLSTEEDIPLEPGKTADLKSIGSNVERKLADSVVVEPNPKTPRLEGTKSELESILPQGSGEDKGEPSPLDLKSVQVTENPEEACEIQDEPPAEPELSGSEKLLSQTLCQDRLQANIKDIAVIENPQMLVKSIPELLVAESVSASEPIDQMIFEVDTSDHKSMEIVKQGDFIPNLLNEKHEIDSQKDVENIAVDDATTAKKSPVSLETQVADIKSKDPERSKKIKQAPQVDPKNASKGTSSATVVPKVTAKVAKKKPQTISSIQTAPKLRNVLKTAASPTRSAVVDKKQAAKTAVLPAVAVKKINVLKEKNIKEAALNSQKITGSTLSAKPPTTRSNALTKPPSVASSLIRKKPPEISRPAKSRPIMASKIDIKSRSTSRPKNPLNSSEVSQKTAKDLEEGEKELKQKQIKIGVVDLKPLIWTETLVPVCEQIWNIYEPTNHIIGEVDKILEKTTKNMLEMNELLEDLEIGSKKQMIEIERTPEIGQADVLKPVTMVNGEKAIQKIVPNPSDSLETVQQEDEKIVVMEQVMDSNKKRNIEVSGSIPLPSSDSAELFVKIKLEISSLEAEILDAITEKDVESEPSKIQEVFREEKKTAKISGLDSLAPSEASKGLENEASPVVAEENEKVAFDEDMDKKLESDVIEEGTILLENEKLEEKLDKDGDNGSIPTATVMTTFKAINAEQQAQPTVMPESGNEQQSQTAFETETVNGGNNRNRGSSRGSHSRYRQKKGHWGGMYSDMPEAYGYNGSSRGGGSRQHQQRGGYHNYPQNEYGEFLGYQQSLESGNTGFRGYHHHQQHSDGYQNYSSQGLVSGEHSQNYSNQQGHRKRNKRNRKPRNWQQ